jgi:hypothetical protein
MKNIEVGKLKLYVCEHKGDITYERFVAFKQYAPQFWERMDSPLFEVYWEKIMDHYNKGEFAQGLMKLKDYKIAIDNAKNSYDAWGVCFALITEADPEAFKSCPNDAQVAEKLREYMAEGLNAEVVKENVINFMQASRETFADHLTLYGIQSMITEIDD